MVKTVAVNHVDHDSQAGLISTQQMMMNWLENTKEDQAC